LFQTPLTKTLEAVRCIQKLVSAHDDGKHSEVGGS
jgi:hypothetical protein